MKSFSGLGREIFNVNQRIRHYRLTFFATPDPWQRMYLMDLIANELSHLEYLLWLVEKEEHEKQKLSRDLHPLESLREFTLEELAQYDGSSGKPAYVAVNGKVYDVSIEATWGGGTHFSLAAGRDLTAPFNECHGMQAILGKLPVIGRLQA